MFTTSAEHPAAVVGCWPHVLEAALAKKKWKPPKIYRDAATGRFVTKKYAKKNPKTTVKVPRS